MSILTDIGSHLHDAVGNVRGWIEDVEKHLPTLIATAEKYAASPIVQALETAVLPAHVEQSIAQLITDAADEYAKLTAATDASAPTSDASSTTPADSTPTDATTTSTPDQTATSTPADASSTSTPAA